MKEGDKRKCKAKTEKKISRVREIRWKDFKGEGERKKLCIRKQEKYKERKRERGKKGDWER